MDVQKSDKSVTKSKQGYGKIPKRIQMLSVPKKRFDELGVGMPKYTKFGTRESALRGNLINSDIAWPYLRKLIALKMMHKKTLSQKRLQQIDQIIKASNATKYSKLANCSIVIKNTEDKDAMKKKAWTESDWKKHMDYISKVAAPKKEFRPPKLPRGKPMPLEALLPRLKQISSRPEFKCYRRMSQESWYRDPTKVSPHALKYNITERTVKLAVPKPIPT